MKAMSWFLILLLALPSPLPAEQPRLLDGKKALGSYYRPKRKPLKKRNLWLPLASFVLPGLDQWWEGQFLPAGIYTGLGVGGGLLYGAAGEYRNGPLAMVSVAGGLSAFHGFRTAVASRKPHGEFAFLKVEETPGELALAPFDFRHLAKPTTLVPFLVAIGLGFLGTNINNSPLKNGTLTFREGYDALVLSYQAGVWEEAIFRGYLMPLTRHYTGSDFASNIITSVLFGAAHYQQNYIPWVQTAFGIYVATVVQQNGWSLSEAIFMHAWYDIFLFAAEGFANNRIQISLPTLNIQF